MRRFRWDSIHLPALGRMPLSPVITIGVASNMASINE